jgi:hypothetical protein
MPSLLPVLAPSSVLSCRAWSWLAAVFSPWHDAAGALLEQSERASRRGLTLLQERAVGEWVTRPNVAGFKILRRRGWLACGVAQAKVVSECRCCDGHHIDQREAMIGKSHGN